MSILKLYFHSLWGTLKFQAHQWCTLEFRDNGKRVEFHRYCSCGYGRTEHIKKLESAVRSNQLNWTAIRTGSV